MEDPPVARAVGAGVVHPHDDEDVLEVRADGLGGEGVSPGLLEHDGHNVVPDVAFPQQLVKTNQTLQIKSNFIYTALFIQKMQWKNTSQRKKNLFASLTLPLPAVCCWACTAEGWTRGT